MVMGNDLKTMFEAWALWDKAAPTIGSRLLAEPEAIEPEFRRFSRLRSSSLRYGQMRTSLRLPRSPVLSSSRLIVDLARREPTCTFYKIDCWISPGHRRWHVGTEQHRKGERFASQNEFRTSTSIASKEPESECLRRATHWLDSPRMFGSCSS